MVCSVLAPTDIAHIPLQRRHNEHDVISNHQPHDCLLKRLFRRRSKKTSKLRITDLCAGNSPGTGEFPAQMASNVENASIWWRHHASGYFTGNGAIMLEIKPTAEHRMIHFITMLSESKNTVLLTAL